MPSHLKDLVRARMAKTGERYEQALRHVRAQEERATSTPAATSPPAPPRSGRAQLLADTAFSIASVRAAEALLPERERLFDDPYAAIFAAAGAHAAESTRRYLELPFFRDGVRLRTRAIDDAVREGLRAGLDQVVLLGAGFDARGLRLPELAKGGAVVFEVDTDEQLERKRRLLEGAGVTLPSHIRWVPFDFEAPGLEGRLTEAMRARGFRVAEGAMFVWEGVIGYIGDDAIQESLRFMATAGGPRSRVVFTFSHIGFETDTATARARRAGFGACEELAGDELWRRYLVGEPHPNAWVMRIATATV